ncbi:MULTISPECIES: SlyX family protein [Paracoccus]|jgi:SlyX protein|uniref:SlyX family protein n=2 Tax=Paracoccus TaxID=265 RepID=A0A5C4RAM9_9RHOB|nr:MULTISPECIES: SlyX family protein [Paracoccus]TYP64592.1 SlyX protein [Stutzerimonas stutzeri]KIX19226.1 SlyX family protein [Paracoccus sp. 228]KJZ32888.1 SlyX family protein [Paracoccus sp. S4493]MCO6364716.1 SlyX protein [Paracoccus sp. 08]QXI64038.1 Protein SlyX [Paracoccus marcusii]|tara:strand:- start:427 stop:642 length:216 start_codon:yes stop_codon:yes gene_type:complete
MDKQQDRLHQLEEALAHLTRLTDELSEVIARQDRDLARVTRRLDQLLLAEAERQADAAGSVALADQRPPHY